MKHRLPLRPALPMLYGLAFFLNSQLVADDISTYPQNKNTITECSKEFLISYFPPQLVEAALEKFNVDKDKQPAITKALSDSEKSIITTIEAKAAKINPNPLKDPQQRQVAVKIFRETLSEVFSGVMKNNGIQNEKEIQNILDEIQQQKAKKFAECLERHRNDSHSESLSESEQRSSKALSHSDSSDDHDSEDEDSEADD